MVARVQRAAGIVHKGRSQVDADIDQSAVVDRLLLGLGRRELRVLLYLHLLYGSLQSVDQSLVLRLDLGLLGHAKGRQCFGSGFGLGGGGYPGLHGSLHLGLHLCLGLRLGADFRGELDEASRCWRPRVHLNEGAVVCLVI